MENNWFITAEKKRESAKNLLSYLGLLVAAATVLVFSALFFTDLSFSKESSVSFSLTFFLLFSASYIMYVSLFETGKSEGERTEEYQALLKKRGELFTKFRVTGNQKTLSLFCKALGDKETKGNRARILDEHFVTEEDVLLIKQKRPAERTVREKRVLSRLARQKAVIITPRAVLAERPGVNHRAPLSLSPERSRRRRTVAFLIPLAAFTALSVSLVFEVIRDPSADAVIGYLLKLFTLLHSAVKGFRAGFYHATLDRCDYMREQCDVLTDYFNTLGAGDE